MLKTTDNLELLAPAGSMEKLEAAFYFGADAVYAGSGFSLRAGANIPEKDIPAAIGRAHALQKKIYITVNTYPKAGETALLAAHLEMLADARPDALIVADPGVCRLAKQYAPGLPLHLSVQANCQNAETACFWFEQGFSRIILARELSLLEIAYIRAHTPKELELEAFVHGAMCVALSGRCLISDHLTARGANRGECAQACRYAYRLAVEEETRPGEYMPLAEEKGYSYLFSSRDLCLINHLPALRDAGIVSFKIEGRNKSAFYVAAVTRAYRAALNAINGGPPPGLQEELARLAGRPLSTGFLFGPPGGQGAVQAPAQMGIAAEVLSYNGATGRALVRQKNRFFKEDVLQVLSPGASHGQSFLAGPLLFEGAEVEKAAQPGMVVEINAPCPLAGGDMLLAGAR